MIKVIGNRGILEVIAIFSVVMLVGFLIADYAIKTSSVYILLNSLQSPQFVDVSYMLDAVLVLIIAMLLLKRNSAASKSLLFRMLEGIVVGFSSYFVFLLVLLMGLGHLYTLTDYYAVAGMAAVVLVLLKNDYPVFKNIAMVTSSMGVGLILGFNFSFIYAVAILAAVAIYDYIGVFRTGSIVKMASAMSSENMSFLMGVSDMEYVPVQSVGIKDALEYERYLERSHKLDNPRYRKAVARGRLPVLSQISLGEGDVSLPLMAIVSSFYYLSNPMITYGLIVSAIMGISVTMLLLKRYKRPLPAVPPLFASISIFVGIAFLFLHTYTLTNTAALVGVGMAVLVIDVAAASRNREKKRKVSQKYMPRNPSGIAWPADRSK